MKKLILSALVAVAAISANAQAQKGNLQTSIDFKPFASNGLVFEGNTGVKVAYFLTDKDAVRVGLNFGTDKKENENKTTDWSISLGYENHFKSYKNIDLYAGAEISYGSTSMKKTETSGDHTIEVKARGGYSEFGIQAFTGINLYVYKQLYLGAEIQLGYSNKSNSKFESASYDYSKEAWSVEEVDPKTSTNNFKIEAYPCLRLGWTF